MSAFVLAYFSQLCVAAFMCIILFVCFLFKTGFLFVALAILELTCRPGWP